jgi:hypothetical protein
VKREQRRAVLEGIIASDDPKVTGGDRLKALEQLERLEEQEREEERQEQLRKLNERPEGPDEALAELDRNLAAHVFAMGYGGGHPETTTDFPVTCAAIAEICAWWRKKGAELGPAEADVRSVEAGDDSPAG